MLSWNLQESRRLSLLLPGLLEKGNGTLMLPDGKKLSTVVVLTHVLLDTDISF